MVANNDCLKQETWEQGEQVALAVVSQVKGGLGDISRGTAGGEEQSLQCLRGQEVITAPEVHLFVQRKVTVACILHICTYTMKGFQL